jgi:Zn-dependent protease
MDIESIIIIVALIISIILHEVAHGYAANALGDPTARLQGRLSLNPLVHIDPVGSILIPALLFLSHAGFLFGWAKPVPYNPYNLSDQRYGDAKVAAAGPATNIAIALVFSVLLRGADTIGLNSTFVELSGYIVYMNILLALFNLIPIPPLDGSKIVTVFLPWRARESYRRMGMWFDRFGLLASFLFIYIFVTLLWAPFSVVVGAVFTAFTGMQTL